MLAFVVIGFAIVICATAVIIYFSYNAKKTSKKTFSITDIYDIKLINIYDIDRLEEQSEFVVYIFRLLKDIGFSNVAMENSSLHSVDIVFTDEAGHKIVVAVKKCPSQTKVDAEAVLEVAAAKDHYKASKAIVVSSTGFTDSSKEIASEKAVILIDRNDLITIMDDHKNRASQAVQNKILALSN